jgi:hypothetical protein
MREKEEKQLSKTNTPEKLLARFNPAPSKSV